MSKKLYFSSVILSALISGASFAQMEIPTTQDVQKSIQDSKKSLVDAGTEAKDAISHILPVNNPPAASAARNSAPPPVQIPPAANATVSATKPPADILPPTQTPVAKVAPVVNTSPSTMALPTAGATLSIPNDPAMLPNPANLTAGNPLPPQLSTTPATPPVAAPALPNPVATTELPPASLQSKGAGNDSPNTAYPATDKSSLFPDVKPSPEETPKIVAKQQRHKGTRIKQAARTPYKHIRLPETIYSKQYDRFNKHLPIAYYESDLIEMLFSRVRENDINGLRAMLDYDKLSINSRTASGETPLIVAVKYNSFNVIPLLLGRHADTSAKDTEGLTALDHANRLGLNHIARLISMRAGSVNISRLSAERD